MLLIDFVVYIDTGSPVPNIPSKSRDLADENNTILTEWKWFETIVLCVHVTSLDLYFQRHMWWSSFVFNRLWWATVVRFVHISQPVDNHMHCSKLSIIIWNLFKFRRQWFKLVDWNTIIYHFHSTSGYIIILHLHIYYKFKQLP